MKCTYLTLFPRAPLWSTLRRCKWQNKVRGCEENNNHEVLVYSCYLLHITLLQQNRSDLQLGEQDTGWKSSRYDWQAVAPLQLAAQPLLRTAAEAEIGVQRREERPSLPGAEVRIWGKWGSVQLTPNIPQKHRTVCRGRSRVWAGSSVFCYLVVFGYMVTPWLQAV